MFVIMVVNGVPLLEPTAAQLHMWGGNHPPSTLGGEWWRLFTSTFLHFGIFHLLVNMWILAAFGFSFAERAFGSWTFLVIYVLSGISGSIASVGWSVFTGSEVVGAGASGAIFGVLGSIITFLWLSHLPVDQNVIKDQRLALIFFLLNSLSPQGGTGNVDHAAHIGGLLMGLVMGALLHRNRPALEPVSRLRISLVTVGAIATLLLGAWLPMVRNTPYRENQAAMALLAANKVDEAAVKFDELIKSHPDFAPAYIMLGAIHADNGDYEQAIIFFRDALERDLSGVRRVFAYKKIGRIYAISGNYSDSIANFNQALAITAKLEGVFSDGEIAEIYNYRGSSYSWSGDSTQAEKDFKEAIRLDPSKFTFYNHLAVALIGTGRDEEANQALAKSRELAPNNPFTEMIQGRLNFYRDDYQSASTSFHRSLEMNPSYMYALIWLIVADLRGGAVNASGYVEYLNEMDKNSWPFPVILHLAGKISSEELFEKVEISDQKLRNEQLCEAFFYSGQYELYKTNRENAEELFRQTVNTQVTHFIEYASALTELKRMSASDR